MRIRTFALVLLLFAVMPAVTLGSNPIPYIDQPLVPEVAAPGGTAFILTVNGTGFVAGSTVQWNGTPRTTAFVSTSQLTAAISAVDIASAGTVSITVSNPTPDGGTSNAVFFQVSGPATSVAYTNSIASAGLTSPVGTIATVVGDFNGDGKQDIATLNSDGSISILLGNGDGSFQPAVVYPLASGSHPGALAVGDFNGDGRLDLVVSSDPSGTHISVLPGNGDGTFGSVINAYSSVSDTVGSALLAGDLNGDGKLDLIVDCESSGAANLCVLLGNGDGTFAAGSIISTGSLVLASAVGDFNRDGILDLAVSYEQSGNAILAVALGNGDGTFGPPASVDTIALPSGAFNASVAAADFDGNGIQDLGYYFQSCNPPNPCTGNFQTYSGNGDGTFQPALPSLGAPAGSSNLVVGDFNGDGVLDVAILNAVLLGHGDGTFAANPVPIPQNATVAADFNHDGTLDFASPAGQAGVNGLLRTPPDFTGFASPTSTTIVAGTNTGYSVQVIPLYGWMSDVTLSVSGLPSGVTASFQPATVPLGNGVSLLALSTTSAAVPGTYTLTLTGTSGAISHSTTITLILNPASADFGGDILPSSQIVAGGEMANYTIQVVPFNGFTGNVTLSVSGLPAGSFASFNPPVVSGGSGTSILSVVAPASSRSGAYILTITGTSGGLSHSGKRELDINSNADFTGSVTTIVGSVLPGQRATYAANVVSLNGFTGTVGLSVSGLPTGVTAHFTPVNVMGGSGTSSLVVNTASTTPPGAYTLTIQGASGSDSKSTTVQLLVNTSPGDFSGSLSPTSQSTTVGNSATYAITIFSISGFTGNVTVSVTGLPPGASLSFSPSNVVAGGSGTTNFTISTTSVTPPGTYTMLVSGTSGGLSHSGSITLTVN